MLLCLLANINRDPEKHPEPFTPDQFRLYREQLEEQPAAGSQAQRLDDLSEEEMVFMIELFNAAFGGKDLRRK